MNHHHPNEERLGRRAFLQDSAFFLACAATGLAAGQTPGPGTGPGAAEVDGHNAGPGVPALRIGLVTDLHAADRPPGGERLYREAFPRLREAAERFREAKVDLAVELGDLIDGSGEEAEEELFLRRIEAEFAHFPGPRHRVLGNHCVASLQKRRFLEICGQREARYSFDWGGFHCVILDGCFRADGVPYGGKNFEWTDAELPPQEREWLRADLAAATGKVLVFIHQRLDVATPYAIRSAALVRGILEASGKVLAVFQGHNHLNDHRALGGIHYVTLTALVDGPVQEGGAYAILDVFQDGALRMTGFHRQKDWDLPRLPPPRRRRV